MVNNELTYVSSSQENWCETVSISNLEGSWKCVRRFGTRNIVKRTLKKVQQTSRRISQTETARENEFRFYECLWLTPFAVRFRHFRVSPRQTGKFPWPSEQIFSISPIFFRQHSVHWPDIVPQIVKRVAHERKSHVFVVHQVRRWMKLFSEFLFS